jgi:hypothetical protein
MEVYGAGAVGPCGGTMGRAGAGAGRNNTGSHIGVAEAEPAPAQHVVADETVNEVSDRNVMQMGVKR